MASRGNKEHRMVFDIRGRRRVAVKVVYAILAVLMGASLFLVVGPLNIGEIFNSEGSSAEASKQFEEQAQRIETKLRKDPEDPDLLLGLTRAQVNAANSTVQVEPNGEQFLTTETLQFYQRASQAWSEYLEATEEPSSGLALLMAPALVKLAELSRSTAESQSNINAAAEAQKIIAEQRPSLNAYSVLALYTYFTGDFKAAEAAEKKAIGFTNSKAQREQVEKQGEETKKRAEKFLQGVKEEEKQRKAPGGGGNPQNLESPGSSLGGAFGGSGALAE
jgi:hypothetical protein